MRLVRFFHCRLLVVCIVGGVGCISGTGEVGGAVSEEVALIVVA